MNNKLFTTTGKKTVKFGNIGNLIKEYKLNLKKNINDKFYNEIFIKIIISKNKMNKNKIINKIYKYYKLNSFYKIFIKYFINNKYFVKKNIYDKCYKYKNKFITLFAKLYIYKYQKFLNLNSNSLIIHKNKIYKIYKIISRNNIKLINLNNLNDKPIVNLNYKKIYIINP